MRYFYITFTAGVGAAAFWKGPKHPLHPEELPRFQTEHGRKLTMATGQITRPEHITITGIIELEDEVARARFPRDFTPEAPHGQVDTDISR
jgi:hypothetical protein